ncbi:hypothetical protein IWQ62_000816 [Dispira parvispora]|uniref:Uncharacterized protein n=1 Tax=Dispira parvispora TaxID=1520584 RepID=A0A9W8AWB8_9FUNG|nr:hypothetical protein IWQ62_000816 [Dispira parvispora]
MAQPEKDPSPDLVPNEAPAKSSPASPSIDTGAENPTVPNDTTTTSSPDPLPEVTDTFRKLRYVAESNDTSEIPWPELRQLLTSTMTDNLQQKVNRLSGFSEEVRQEISQEVQLHTNRLATILEEFNRTPLKYLRALEKVILVTSSVDNFPTLNGNHEITPEYETLTLTPLPWLNRAVAESSAPVSAPTAESNPNDTTATDTWEADVGPQPDVPVETTAESIEASEPVAAPEATTESMEHESQTAEEGPTEPLQGQENVSPEIETNQGDTEKPREEQEQTPVIHTTTEPELQAETPESPLSGTDPMVTKSPTLAEVTTTSAVPEESSDMVMGHGSPRDTTNTPSMEAMDVVLSPKEEEGGGGSDQDAMDTEGPKPRPVVNSESGVTADMDLVDNDDPMETDQG